MFGKNQKELKQLVCCCFALYLSYKKALISATNLNFILLMRNYFTQW